MKIRNPFILISLLIFFAAAAYSVPARRGLGTVAQPDGSTLQVRLVGDEFLHFHTTADGYSLVRNEQGAYVYATLEDGQLVPTAFVAHNEAERSEAERSMLLGLGKHLTPQLTSGSLAAKEAEYAMRARARKAAHSKAPLFNYSNFKGLIILVEYNDCSFSRSDYAQIAQDMVNKENYSGFYNERNVLQKYTGSVRDYFSDNSSGMFSPHFDIVGPVKIDRSQYYVNGTENSMRLTNDVLNAVDSQVNFADYDLNKDGVVDMVYFIFAGNCSSVSGNDQRLLWPHAFYIYTTNTMGRTTVLYKDGVQLGRYACSTELNGAQSNPFIDGIGTICHEFGHVLGLPDLYDTDYETNGMSNHPGVWSIMAAGTDLNYGRTPAGYGAYERYAVGFTTPETIQKEGSYSLEDVSLSGKCYRINSAVNKEFFLLENRQKSKWDMYLPGTGMLVFRVDSTSSGVWERNEVNNNTKHNYYEMVRANGSAAAYDTAADPFPGSAGVKMLSNATQPANLKSWTGKYTPLGLSNISADGGVISFDVFDVNVLKSLTLPSDFTIGVGISRQLVPGRFPEDAPYSLTWKSSNPGVASVDQSGNVVGVAPGSTVITVSDAKGVTGSVTVTVELQTVAENISQFCRLDNGAEAALKLAHAQVIYVYKDNYYVRDSSGSVLFTSHGLDIAQNDILDGVVYGKVTITNNVPAFNAVSGKTDGGNLTVSAGSEPLPRDILVDHVTASDYSDMLTLRQARLEVVTTGDAPGMFAVSDSKRIRLYNTFGIRNISSPKDYEGKYYNVTGILGTRLLNGSLVDELSLLKSLEEVTPEAIASVGGEKGSIAVSGGMLCLSGFAPNAEVRVYSLYGRLQLVLHTGADGNLIADTSTWPKGLYIVKCQAASAKVMAR